MLSCVNNGSMLNQAFNILALMFSLLPKAKSIGALKGDVNGI